ncbi:hypothetical protein [Georgenia soli]|nr:hypothetical protein [Georgenia soli]
MSQIESSFAPGADPMAEYRALGRFLGIGMLAGGVIGGFAGALATWSPDSPGYAVGGLSGGAALGIVLGLLTEAVTFVLVIAARAIRPALARTTGVLLSVGVPVVAVTYVSTWAAGIASHGTGRSVVVIGGALALAAGAVTLTARWSLSPLEEAPVRENVGNSRA